MQTLFSMLWQRPGWYYDGDHSLLLKRARVHSDYKIFNKIRG